MRGLRAHDPVAFQLVREHYLPSIWRYVLIRVDHDLHVAEDILSDTMLALIQAFDATENDVAIVNLSGWLRTVATHKVQDYYRAAARVRHLIDTAQRQAVQSDPADNPAHQEEAEERRMEVRRAMDRLPEQYRLGLEWKYVEKLSVREMAARWGMSEKAAESVLFRARRALRDRLNNELPAASAANPQQGEPSSPLAPEAEENRQGSPRTACDVRER